MQGMLSEEAAEINLWGENKEEIDWTLLNLLYSAECATFSGFLPVNVKYYSNHVIGIFMDGTVPSKTAGDGSGGRAD